MFMPRRSEFTVLCVCGGGRQDARRGRGKGSGGSESPAIIKGKYAEAAASLAAAASSCTTMLRPMNELDAASVCGASAAMLGLEHTSDDVLCEVMCEVSLA